MNKSLKHYSSVLKEEKDPNYLKTKSKELDFKKNTNLSSLWKKHREQTTDPDANHTLLDLKTEIAEKLIENCSLCHRKCRVNRREKETGYCGVPAVSRYSTQFIHHGEEPELVPSHTIFLSGCTFRCIYCQNWETSTRPKKGTPLLPKDLAKKIIRKKLEGAKNVNFVGGEPTPHLHSILKTLTHLETKTPIIWNSNMYMSKETMKILEGTIDLYLADFRYGNNECAKKHSDAPGYMETIKRNLKTSDNQADIIIRHLVLPNHIECCTKPIIEWCTENLGKDVRFNLMFQYRPDYQAKNKPKLNRELTKQEKQRALQIAKENNLNNLVNQELKNL